MTDPQPDAVSGETPRNQHADRAETLARHLYDLARSITDGDSYGDLPLGWTATLDMLRDAADVLMDSLAGGVGEALPDTPPPGAPPGSEARIVWITPPGHPEGGYEWATLLTPTGHKIGSRICSTWEAHGIPVASGVNVVAARGSGGVSQGSSLPPEGDAGGRP